ncbi:hypothetical protein VC83_04145 [Pseudogymnoascus destructans]|uniref:CENP-V/GFA domain-containing protein n=1 Tax=Pseudogymnoascus destructans TaxID=655981 RepID=A0A177AC33_9PEZI|nr:uncharacterized protein VC83_04145 [Pseudogymnoascus destructans]OAF59350.1 hypothetical protein VC83_04145 [Pseudogymnoascus destructans]
MSEEEPKTNHGSCHCSNFAFTVNVPKINRGARCNCSLCHRKGYFWLSVTPEQFKADEGTGELASKKVDESFIAVNLNTVKDLDRKAPEVKAARHIYNCSICTIHANVISYHERHHYQITGIENTTAYFMGDKWIAHRFCKRCGTPVCLDTQTGPPAHVLAKIPEFYHPRLKAYPTNLRVINGLDWKELGINELAPGQGADAN